MGFRSPAMMRDSESRVPRTVPDVSYLGSPYFSGYANDNRSVDTSAVVSAKCRYRDSRVKGFPVLPPRARVIEEQPQEQTCVKTRQHEAISADAAARACS